MNEIKILIRPLYKRCGGDLARNNFREQTNQFLDFNDIPERGDNVKKESFRSQSLIRLQIKIARNVIIKPCNH
jgi:hypothetical protein